MKVIKFLLKAILLFILLLAAAIGCLLAFDIPIPLTSLREDIDTQLTNALGREISIDGDIVLVSGTTPSLRVEKITIENPAHWNNNGRLAYLERFETTIGLSELLHQEIDIDDITIAGLALSLEENADGQGNWEGLAAPKEPTPDPENPDPDEQDGLKLSLTGLDFITVTDLSLTRKIAGAEVESMFRLNGLNGSALAGDPVQLAVTGHLLELPFEGSFTGGTLDALLAGAQKWPYEFDLNLQEATLAVKGTMAANNFKTPGALEFVLEIPDVQSLTPITGPLPLTGGMRLSGQALRKSLGQYQLPELKGQIAKAAITASVDIDMKANPPHLTGEINVNRFDLGALGADPDAPNAPPETDHAPSVTKTPPAKKTTSPPEPASSPPPPTLLPVTGTFALNIKEITGLRATVRDIKLNLDVNPNSASAEVGVVFADAPFIGQLDLQRNPADGTNTMNLELAGNDADLTGLARVYTGDDHLSGQFESASLKVKGSGSSLKSAWDKRHVDIQIANAGMHYRTDKKTWDFLLETGSILREHGSPGEILAKGTLSDAAYELRIPFLLPEGATFGQISSITGHIADLEFEVLDATPKDAKPYSLLEFALDIPDVQSLTPITGPLPLTGALRFSGQAFRKSFGHYQLPELKGEIAKAAVTGSVEIDMMANPPHLTGEIDVTRIDLGALGSGQDSPDTPMPEEKPPADEKTPAITKAAPPEPEKPSTPPPTLLPVTGSFALRIKEISGLPMSARNIALDLDVTKDTATAAVGIVLASAPYNGQLDLERNPENGTVTMGIHLEGQDAELTELVRTYTDDDRISGHFESAVVKANGTGSSLKDAWDNRNADIQINNAAMSYLTDDKDWKFFLESGNIHRDLGKTGNILATGTLSDAAYELRMHFQKPEGTTIGHFDQMTGKIADIDFDVRDATPEDAKPYSLLEFDLKGGSLAKLDRIYELDLPPLGPYAASGSVDIVGKKLSLEGVKLQIGDSVLLADIQLDKTTKPHSLTATLNAETIQLDDFTTAGWSLTGGKESSAAPPPEKKKPQPESDATAPDGEPIVPSTLPRGLLSYQVLSSLNANIALEVGEVLSGPDRLGKANAKLSIKDARAQLEPLTLAIPGGRIDGSILFHPKANDTLDWKIRLDATRADVSVFARRLDPDTKLAGTLNLDLDLSATGVPFGAPQMNLASGRLAFSACPENLDAGVLDIWATNIVLALLPKLDPEDQSKLNCIVAELHLDDGIIFPEVLGLDTTTLRMVGEGGINLQENTIDLTLTPYPKDPQILSIEAPVSITGTLTDPAIEMGALPIARTIGRMAKNIILFPLKVIANEELPEDGSDICACMANYSPNPEADGALIPGQEPNTREDSAPQKEE